MADAALQIVRETLQAYADRSIFRGFGERKKGQFSFTWMLHHQMLLQADTTKHTLRFKQLLPAISARSALYTELKNFIHHRHRREVPEHRRIDRRRAEVSCSNRGGFVSITLNVKNNHYAYGINKIVNLVHDLFMHLRDAHPEYLMENFDVPQE